MLRSNHRALSSERSGPVHKPLRLEQSLLQRRGYLFSLGGLRVLWVVTRMAWCTKRFWEDISPYSIVSVQVAFSTGRHCGLPFPTLCFLTFETLQHFTLFHFSPSKLSCLFSDSLHLLPQPGKSPRLHSLFESRYLLQLMTMYWHHLTLSLWSYYLCWDCSEFILLWQCWLLFLLAFLSFLNLECVLLSLPKCVLILGLFIWLVTLYLDLDFRTIIGEKLKENSHWTLT